MSSVILLTGGIATGKTFVSDYLAELGATVVDTDQISRELTDRESKNSVVALQEIYQLFGEEYFDEVGALNRSKLRDKVFSDDLAKKELEAILHPKIESVVNQLLSDQADKYFVLVIPLITADSQYINKADRVLTIELYLSKQIDRLMKRDRIAPSLAHKIIESQISRLARRQLANDIIINDNRKNTMRRLRLLHQQYKYIGGGAHDDL